MLIRRIKIIVVSFLLIASTESGAVTTISDSSGLIPADQIAMISGIIQSMSDSIGPAMTTAYSLGNVAGYPMGTSHINKFFVGISVNAGLANMYYFDPAIYKPPTVLPGFGINPVIYFGIGLGPKMDIMAKFMAYSDAIYLPPLSYPPALTLKRFNFYSAGAKFRYALMDKTQVFPGLFDFGGIALTAGADFMYGLIGFSGAYPVPIGSLTLDVPAPGTVYSANFNPSYTMTMSFWMISPSIQAVVYFDLFWIFRIYSGIGVSMNFGSFDVGMDGSGELNVSPDPAPATNPISTLSVISTTSYLPPIAVPLYILGLDINLYVIQISVETMVSFLNLRDINIQIGFRSQW